MLEFTGEKLATASHYFGLAEYSNFSGKPSTELDNSWDALLSGINIRVSSAELKKANQTSVRITNSQNHLAWLEVSHQLHCVVLNPFLKLNNCFSQDDLKKYLRQAIYREHYFPEITGEKISHWLLHTGI